MTVADCVIKRRMAGQVIGELQLIDAVEFFEDDGRHISLFFQQAVSGDRIVAPDGSELVLEKSVAGAAILTYRLPAEAELIFQHANQTFRVTPAEVEQEQFEGSNAIVAIRNGESAVTVLDWLSYHVTHHQLDGAVILDRAKPATDEQFATQLNAGLIQRKLGCRIVVIDSDLPLGKATLPAEAHPYCVPGAPGKDRMKVPAPAPWASPFAALNWFEIARARFLGMARAVCNIDVHDLLEPDSTSVFDKAVMADGGTLNLIGRHCYPWRVRNKTNVQFGDHICVQFDAKGGRHRWCIAPAKAPPDAIWRLLRVGNITADPKQTHNYFRHMALRHPTDSVSKIVPKTSLIENAFLLSQSKKHFGHKPIRVPKIKAKPVPKGRGRRAIVTTMKNEGPFILEWLAYHRAIGFDDILVYTNDCTDGTDTMLQMLMGKGIVEHRQNRFREMDLKPQHAALQMAEQEPVIQDAKWITCIDVDEYVNIKIGDGSLDALFDAVPDANLISMTWRLFGNADVHEFEDRPITEQFRHCANELTRKPHQAWGFKTLFLNNGIFKKLGVHRPKGLNPQLWEDIHWVNGSGDRMPRAMYRNGWRSTTQTYGYDLVQLNHYAVRSAESFLVKRDRGRVNHVDRDQGLAYWFRMNNNIEVDDSVHNKAILLRAELANLMADTEIADAHDAAVKAHVKKIQELRKGQVYNDFYAQLTDTRLEKLSRLHSHFGANVFLSGPDVIPDEIADKDPEADWFFTVEPGGQTHH